MSAVAQTSPGQDANVLSGEPPATPAQFLRWLHGDLRHRICIVRRIERDDEPGAVTFRDHTIHRDDLPWQLQCPDVWLESPDTYVMINETRRQRLARDVVCLKAFVVDLDCHQADDLEPEAARDQALAKLDAAGLPRPHLCVETGRGVQLIWRLGRVGLKKAHRNAQVRWAKTQQALARICGPQADLSLVDLPRVIRLPGTVNTKAPPARRLTRSHWVPGASAADYSFDALCDAALGISRRSFVARYVRKQADNDEAPSATPAADAATKPARKTRRAAGGTAGFESLAVIAAARLRDLEKIAQRHFLAGIPEGYRDIFIMAVATDMSWVTPLQQADAFSDLVIHRLKVMGAVVDERTHSAYLGRINAPLSVTEARRNLGSVVRRFRDAAAGAKVEFAGQLRDPRYWYGTERKWSLIGPMLVDDDELLGRLEELLPRHLRQTRQARRRGAGDSAVASDGGAGNNAAQAAQAARNRVAEGRYKRARPTTAQRNQVLAALDSGLDLKAAADLAGVTTRTIYNWMARRVEATVGPSGPPVAISNAASAGLVPLEEAFEPMPAASEAEGEGGPVPAVKKRPFPYMALPGAFPPEKSKTVLGFGPPATQRCGQPLNPLAGHQPVTPRCGPQADSRVVHAHEDPRQGSGEGGGAGEGRALWTTPPGASQTSQLPGVSGAANYLCRRGGASNGQPATLAALLAALANQGRLPQRPDRRDGRTADGAGVPRAPGAQPVKPAGSGQPAAPGTDGLAQLPPVAQNDQDFGPPCADDR